jgi:hypothetical protein
VGFRLRAGRGTNLALLVLLIGALVTGGLAFAIGGAWAFWALAAHGAVGLGLVLLAPWKSVISARGLRRARPGTAASMLLAVLIVLTVASGIAHAVGVWTGGLAMQVHVGAALLSIPLAIWHVVARPVRPRPSDLSRRSLLRAGAVAGGGVMAFGAIEGLVRATGLPGSDRRATGSYERGSFDPAEMPVTQWLDDEPPEIDPADWRLIVRTSEGESTLSFEELAAFSDRVRATVDCTPAGGSRPRTGPEFAWTGSSRRTARCGASSSCPRPGTDDGSRSPTQPRCFWRRGRANGRSRPATASRSGSSRRADAGSGG